MKKVAVLIAGQYREFDTVIKSWKFLNLPAEFDIYFTTWNTTYETDYKTDIRLFEELVTIERIHKNIIPTDYTLFNEVTGQNPPTKYIFLIRQCILLMIKSSRVYDTVVLIRPDVFVDEKMEIDKVILDYDIPDNFVYGHGELEADPDGGYSVRDCIFITNQKTIEQFLQLPVIDPLYYGLERHFGELYFKNNIISKIIPGDWSMVVARSNSRDLEHPNIETVKQLTKDWWNLKHPENKAE